MTELSVTGLVKEFEAGSPVLNGFSLRVESGERVGLLGCNGAGKTTLFRILTGQLDWDEGEVSIAPGRRLGLISQIPVYPDAFTVEDVLRTAFARVRDMEREMEQLAQQMERASRPELLRRYDALAAAHAQAGGYDTDTQLNKVCSGLSIPAAMRAQLFSSLSGGEQTRVNLGRLILEDTDLLLLDEPTNHLDMRAAEWLEAYLERFRGTVLVISHDRWFLDRVVQRIVELRQGRAELYAGNYSFYAVERERRRLEQQRKYEREQAEIQRLTQSAKRMHEHNTELLHKRAFSMERRAQRLAQTQRPQQERQLKTRFGQREFFGDELLELENLGKGYDGRRLFDRVNLRMEGGERIALLGDNGAGKSTLLKLLAGEEAPDEGRIRKGPSVRMGYLPQHIRFDQPGRSLVDTMLYQQNCSVQEARDRLAAFRFQGEDVLKPVSALSGGEQSRLRLCMLMQEKINLLLLDEPTNHLDIASREWMEAAVEEFEGALLFVSHDRYFINRFASRIWVLSQGGITDFQGDFAQYRAHCQRQQELAQTAQTAAPPPPSGRERPRRTGGTKQLEKQLAAAEREAARAEEEISRLNRAMEEAASDYVKLQELLALREEEEARLAGLYETWERLGLELEEAR